MHVKVHAAPWVPVDEVRFVVNGQVVKTIGGLPAPADPFAHERATSCRYEGEVALVGAARGRHAATRGSWSRPGARCRSPAISAAGSTTRTDGVPDTTDNNGDGVVDATDVATGEKIGPLEEPCPTRRTASRASTSSTSPSGYPFAFTNPFVLDRDGDGKFTAPGVKGGR